MNLSHASGTRRVSRKTSTGRSASRALGPRKAFVSPTSCGDRQLRNIQDGRILRIEAKMCSSTSASPSSCAVPVEPAALKLLADLSRVLADWGRWYVFGAQAVIAYGVPRLSADVDVTIWLVPDDPERLRNGYANRRICSPCRRPRLRPPHTSDAVRPPCDSHARGRRAGCVGSRR